MPQRQGQPFYPHGAQDIHDAESVGIDVIDAKQEIVDKLRDVQGTERKGQPVAGLGSHIGARVEEVGAKIVERDGDGGVGAAGSILVTVVSVE